MYDFTDNDNITELDDILSPRPYRARKNDVDDPADIDHVIPGSTQQ